MVWKIRFVGYWINGQLGWVVLRVFIFSPSSFFSLPLTGEIPGDGRILAGRGMPRVARVTARQDRDALASPPKGTDASAVALAVDSRELLSAEGVGSRRTAGVALQPF